MLYFDVRFAKVWLSGVRIAKVWFARLTHANRLKLGALGGAERWERSWENKRWSRWMQAPFATKTNLNCCCHSQRKYCLALKTSKTNKISKYKQIKLKTYRRWRSASFECCLCWTKRCRLYHRHDFYTRKTQPRQYTTTRVTRRHLLPPANTIDEFKIHFF